MGFALSNQGSLVIVFRSGTQCEINVTCDIYKDNSGLQYWLLAEDSPTGKKGDLLEIVYGPSQRTVRQIVGS
jgi:hypothetical protein